MSTMQETMTDRLERPGIGADDFSYRPMPALVPVSMAFTCLSLLALMSDLLLIVPLLGIVLSFVAYYQISRSRGDLSGGGLAIFSLVLMLLMCRGALKELGATHADELPRPSDTART